MCVKKAPDVAIQDERVVIEPMLNKEYPNGRELLMKDGDGESMHVLKRCYRKHVLDDNSIGWDELCDDLCDALSNTMGDDEFQKWLKAL